MLKETKFSHDAKQERSMATGGYSRMKRSGIPNLTPD
jgi:hypothetical protein